MLYIKGFESYRWVRDWGNQKQNDYVFKHRKFKSIKLTVDEIEDIKFDTKVSIQINGKGEEVEKTFGSEEDMEKNLGIVFKELVSNYANLEVLFKEVFK